jgi:polyhydroxybutyrate depolymerase
LALPQAASSSAFDSYTLHRPANLSRNQQVPIVLTCCGGPTAQTKSIMDGLADRFGFVVVYLAPTKTYNDLARARGPGPPFPDSIWASGVIDQVLQSQNGNPSRVYSTGVSAGGTFSYRLACDMPNKIAAIGSVSGLDVVPGCKPSRPISVIEIHGLRDTTIPFNPGRPGFLSIPQVIAKWRDIDNCSAASNVTTTGVLREETWSNCAGNTGVEMATISNAGHGWPTTADTGGVLWRFLNAHPLAATGGAGGGSAATAKIMSTAIKYKPTRRVIVRVNLGQTSSLRLTLSRGTRTLASRSVAQAKAGVSSYTLRVPRTTKPGTVKLKIVAKAGTSQVTATRLLKLRK